MSGIMSVSGNSKAIGIIASVALSFLSFALSLSNVEAHTVASQGQDKDAPNGIKIASIAHSDMEVLAEFWPKIISLAERQIHTDERLRRLLNFSKIQYTYCLWGLVPGSLTNEESAFNTCSHAYLASAWALLKHMESPSIAGADAAAIARSIDVERAARPSFVLCKSSADVFYTDKVIVPQQVYAAVGWFSGLLLLVGMLPILWARRPAFR